MGVRRYAGTINMPAISAVMQLTVSVWYEDATIEIVNPDINGGNYNRLTNSKTRNPQLLWTGKARIQATSYPSVVTARQAAMSLREATFHVAVDPLNPFPDYVQQGWRIKVTECPLGKQFVGGLYTINTAINSSYDWDYRIETVMDQGSQVS